MATNLGKKIAESSLDPVKNIVPLATLGLAEQPHGRIQGAILTLEQPTPVGNLGQGDPNGNAESTAKWAMAVSTVMTRSRQRMTAAASARSVDFGAKIDSESWHPFQLFAAGTSAD